MFNVKFIIFCVAIYSVCFSTLVEAEITEKQLEQFEERFLTANQWGIPYPKDVLNEKWHQQAFFEFGDITRTLKLSTLLNGQPLKLEGNTSKLYANFGNRLDRVITDAVLNLDFIYSPTLLSRESQVKVSLNDELVGVISIDENKAGQVIHQQLKLPNLPISDFNQLKFELIGYYEGQCVTPFHKGLWFEFMSTSNIDITQRMTSLDNDLSLLPAPFFDPRQMTKQTVTFVFPEKPSTQFIKSASKFGAWFGVLNKWRGSDFKLNFNELPSEHAIVFATNDNRPFFLKDYPEVFEPTLVMVSHPLNRKIKLLLVLGKDDEQLDIAAEGGVMAHHSLSGQAAMIEQIKYKQKLKPYDAPLWINTDRPMRFSEFVDNNNQLQQAGIHLSSIKMDMHIPTDLFVWETHGIPVDLSYRYTPPSAPDLSMLNILINNQLVESITLDDSYGIVDESSRIRMPFSTDEFTGASDVLVPSFKLGIQNTMEFDFILKDKKGDCLSDVPEKVVAIDGDSIIDFSGFEHYAEMPDLTSFAFSGLPFTKMADLSETTIVLPDNYAEHEVSLLFSVLAKLSSITGYPAINFNLQTTSTADSFIERDIILINALETNGVTSIENEKLNVLIDNNHRSISLASELFEHQYSSNSKFALKNSNQALVSIDSKSGGDLAAMTEFESPFTDGRSVLSIMSTNPSNLVLVEEALHDPSKSYQVRGASVVIHKNKILSTIVGDKYYTGHLPVWNLTRYHLSQRPGLLLATVLFSVLLLAIIFWRLLTYVAHKRLNNDETR